MHSDIRNHEACAILFDRRPSGERLSNDVSLWVTVL